MKTDIVLCKEEMKDLGYDKVLHARLRKTNNKEDLRKLNKKELIIVEGSKLNREVIESGKVDILANAEKNTGRDAIHQRNSGLNHVMCKIAEKKDVAIGFSFSSILNARGEDRWKLMGKIRQNIRLCRKYKTRMVFCSFAEDKWEMRNAEDMKAFARVLGMTASEAKKAVDISDILHRKEEQKKYIAEGVFEIK